MHSSTIRTVSIASVSTTPAAAPIAERDQAERSLSIVHRLEARAESQLSEYFAGGSIASANEASPVVKALLDAIPAHHRGALGLCYRPRFWSDAVSRALGKQAGIAIRLYCADHPSSGPTLVLERAAADRVAAIYAATGGASSMLADLSDRASEIHHDAVRAYAKELAKLEANEVAFGDDREDARYHRAGDDCDAAFDASNDNGDVR